jgi:hypothetical protein
MKMRARLILVGASLSLGLLAATLPAAAETAMQSCSSDWSKLKSSNKVPEGQTWPKFWSQCSKDFAAANPADDAAAAPAAKAKSDAKADAKAKPDAKAAKTTAAKTTAPAADAKPAGQTAMKSCSDDWAKMKAADSVPAGQTWPKFWSQCSKDFAAANATDDAAAAPAAKPAKTTAAKTTAPAADAKPAGQTAMASCSDDWAKLKAAGNVPAGQTWPKFWSQCSKDFAAANATDDAAPTKAAKTTKAAAPVDDETGIELPDPDTAAKLDTTKTTVGKRQMTPGQQAAVVRIRACGAEWQKNKAAGKLPDGAKWPQYWSDCNKRLKAKGQ